MGGRTRGLPVLNVSAPGRDCRCIADLRSQRTGSATMQVFDKRAAVSCKSLSLVVELWCCWATHGLPLRAPVSVRIDRDPPMCLDAQGGIKAKRQPLCGLSCLVVMCLGRDRRDVFAHILSDVGERLRSQSLQTFSCRDLQCCAPRGSCSASPL